MNSSLDSDQVWVSIVKAFEQIFQFLQLPLIKGALMRPDVKNIIYFLIEWREYNRSIWPIFSIMNSSYQNGVTNAHTSISDEITIQCNTSIFQILMYLKFCHIELYIVSLRQKELTESK